jgi:hypothetical protein
VRRGQRLFQSPSLLRLEHASWSSEIRATLQSRANRGGSLVVRLFEIVPRADDLNREAAALHERSSTCALLHRRSSHALRRVHGYRRWRKRREQLRCARQPLWVQLRPAAVGNRSSRLASGHERSGPRTGPGRSRPGCARAKERAYCDPCVPCAHGDSRGHVPRDEGVTKKPCVRRAFLIGAPRFELGTSSPPD